MKDERERDTLSRRRMELEMELMGLIDARERVELFQSLVAALMAGVSHEQIVERLDQQGVAKIWEEADQNLKIDEDARRIFESARGGKELADWITRQPRTNETTVIKGDKSKGADEDAKKIE